MENRIKNELKMWGIHSNLKGYRYLQEAIRLILTEGDDLLQRKMSLELFPRIAKKFGTTPICVERNIRTAAGSACRKVPEMFLAVFGKKSVTTGVFISELVDRVQSNSAEHKKKAHIIRVDGFMAFTGAMLISPVNGVAPFELTGDWLFRPDTGCWYGGGHSYAENICKIIG